MKIGKERAEQKEGVVEELQAAFDEKSERWQESDAGEKVRDMISEWEGSFDEPDITEPEDVEFDDEPLRSFRDLPEES
jgi:hypothetical protein